MRLWDKNLLIISILFLCFGTSWAAKPMEKLPVGQLLFIGIQGEELNSNIQGLLDEVMPGGIILFKRNITTAAQTLNFNSEIIQLFAKKNVPLPFLAIDQEGGGVYRVPTEPLLPSAAALGRTKNKDLIYKYGRTIGKILRDLKFTMNLAPVLDLRKKESDFIGSRSYGKNPKEVSSDGILFAKGLLEEGILPTGKHFPGVGGLNLDPHKETPLGDLDWSKSWNKDLFPFREFAKLYPSALLLSHVVYPQLDSNRRPASFSANIIEKGLRKKINFKGLVITDDLMMEGAKKQAGPLSSAIESLKSGADMIMVTWSEALQKKLVHEIQEAIEKGILSYKAVKEKIARIAKIKKVLMNKEYLESKTVDISFKSTELEELNTELLREIIEQDNTNTIGLKKNIGDTPLYVVDSPVRVQKDILTHRSQKLTEFFNIKKTEDWQRIRKRLNKNKQSLVLFFVKSVKALKNLDWFTDEEKKQIILVNIYPVNMIAPEKYAGVYAPLWTFGNLYSCLEEALNKKTIKVSVK